MPRYSYADLKNDSLDFGGKVAVGARRFACSIWQKYARNYTGSNANNALSRWLFNSAICDNPYQPPPPPFTGGQCNFAYNCKTTATYLMRPAPTDPGLVVTVEYKYPPIAGPISVTEEIAFVAGYTFGGAQRPPPASLRGFLAAEWSLISPPDFTAWMWSWNVVQNHVISSVVPTSGQPDTCGNVPTGYPPPPPLPDGGENYDVDIEDPDGNSVSITLNYNDVNFNFPLTFNFDGGFINVDIGGVSLNWNGDFNWYSGGDSAGKNPFPEAPAPGGGGGGGPNPQPDSDGVEKRPPVEIEDGEEVEETEEEDEQILWVEILMTKQPYQKHRILYLNSDLNIYYGGWLAWTGGEGSLNSAPEIPIRRSRTLVRKPAEYTGYKVRAINGASYTVTSYTQKMIKRQSKGEGL